MSALKNFWSRLSQNGVQTHMNFVLQQRIILSNWVSVASFFAGFIFVILFVIRGNDSLFPLFLMMIIAIIIQLLNYLHLDKLSRFILSILPSFASFAVTLITKIKLGAESELIHYVAPRLFILVTITIPLTLFIWKEWIYMLLALTLIVSIVLGYDYINTYFAVGYEQVGIESEYYHIIYEDIFSITLTLLILFVFLFRINDKYESINQKLLKETQIQNQELQKNQTKLQQSLQELQFAKEQEKNQIWVSKELNSFNQLLRSESNLQDNSTKIINYLAHCLHALQINLYLFVEDTQKLSLCNSFAPEDNLTVKEFFVGEGLVGQVAKNNDILHLENLEHQNKKLTTSSSEFIIKSLIIMPLIHNKVVKGVIEFGFLQEVPNYYISFIKSLSENLGAYIHNFYLNDYNKKLLEESKEYTENLRKQEQEYHRKIRELEHEIRNIRKEEFES